MKPIQILKRPQNIAAVVLDIVFGVVLKDSPATERSGPSGGGPSYKVEVHWQASTYVWGVYGFIEYGTEATLKDGGAGGEGWNDSHEVKIFLDVQDDGTTVAKSEVYGGDDFCCTNLLIAGNTKVSSGSNGDWGPIQTTCSCTDIWYDEQIRVKVTMI